MTVPRILIVDDQRDVTRVLRAALEALGKNYSVVEAVSAEAALVEVGRGPLDLLITDVRLPGMSGLDLIRQLRSQAAQAEMIVITAYRDEATEAECRRLGASLFHKPLNLEAVVNRVQEALGARAKPAPPRARPPAPPNSQTGISDRLARLRQDLGAAAVFMVDLDGKIAVRAGDVSNLDLAPVLVPLMTAFYASLKVSLALGERLPANVQFFDGGAYDIYVANVGQQLALVILFAGKRGSTQMGPVMRYGRQAAEDVLQALKELGIDVAAPRPMATRAAAAPGRRKKTSQLPSSELAAPSPPPEPAPPAPPPKPAVPLTPEELKALDEAAQQVTAESAASFWDSAGAGADIGDIRSDTITFEEAGELGLLPGKKK